MDDFEAFLERQYVDVFWFSCSKHQASKAHTLSELSDYSEEDRQQIERTTIWNSWTLAIPISERARLREAYRLGGVGDARLDLLVLGNDESLAQFTPDPARFSLTYENSIFRVYVDRRRRIPTIAFARPRAGGSQWR